MGGPNIVSHCSLNAGDTIRLNLPLGNYIDFTVLCPGKDDEKMVMLDGQGREIGSWGFFKKEGGVYVPSITEYKECIIKDV